MLFFLDEDVESCNIQNSATAVNKSFMILIIAMIVMIIIIIVMLNNFISKSLMKTVIK